jgi:hypothetical protein
MTDRDAFCVHAWAVGFLPNHVRYEVVGSEYFVQEQTHAVLFRIVQMDPNAAVGSQQLLHQEKAIAHERQPGGVFHPVVVVLKGLTCVERRIDVDQFDFAAVLATESR